MTRFLLILSAALPLTAGLVACDPTTPNGPIDPPEECPADDGLARVLDAEVDGDTLTATVGYSGCSEAEAITPCWDGSFMESFPVQIALDLSTGPAQMCQAYFEHTAEIDLVPLRRAYEDTYGEGPGSMVINLDGMSVLYAF